MQSNKYSFCLLLAFVALPAQALERFLPKSCLEASYKNKTVHSGPLFGLLPHELTIEKKNCVITISHKRYLPREWVIDVCREPVHIKVTSVTGTDVAKKTEGCVLLDKSKSSSDFCGQYFDLMDVIQDDGLIFADGNRDSLYTPHGKTYCAYLLLGRYLGDSVLFSRYTDVPEIFEHASHQKPEVPTAPPIAPAAATPAAVPAAAPVPKN